MASLEQLDYALRGRFADTSLKLCLSAVQIFMWIYMVVLRSEASLETRRRRLPYLIISFLILALYTAGAVTESMYTYSLLFEVQPGFENVGAVKAAYWGRYLRPAHLLVDLAIRVADGVLVHRCYVVWFDRPWVTILPACIFLAGTGIGLRTYIPLDFVDEKLNIADVSLTVVLNVLITILISFRLIRAHRKMAIAFPDNKDRTYIGILAVLIESAAPIAVFGLLNIITSSRPGLTAYKVYTVFDTLYITALILAPQLVIFRVAIGRSWSNRADAGSILTQPMQFAAKPGSESRSTDLVSEQ